MNESLKLLRAQKKLSQSQVAEFIGVSRQMYIKYENGETELSASSIQKLCELYNVSADVIYDIACLVREGFICIEELEEFSDDLQEAVNNIVNH